MANASAVTKRESIVASVRDALGDEAADFAAVYLFGSTARGTERPDSDVDLAVIRARPAASPLSRLHTDFAGRVERALQRPAEVVDLESAPVDLVHRILSEGVLVHEGDRSRRIAVETRRRAEYFDMQPILQEYRHGRNAR